MNCLSSLIGLFIVSTFIVEDRLCLPVVDLCKVLTWIEEAHSCRIRKNIGKGLSIQHLFFQILLVVTYSSWTFALGETLSITPTFPIRNAFHCTGTHCTGPDNALNEQFSEIIDEKFTSWINGTNFWMHMLLNF